MTMLKWRAQGLRCPLSNLSELAHASHTLHVVLVRYIIVLEVSVDRDIAKVSYFFSWGRVRKIQSLSDPKVGTKNIGYAYNHLEAQY